mgnify:FL=1
MPKRSPWTDAAQELKDERKVSREKAAKQKKQPPFGEESLTNSEYRRKFQTDPTFRANELATRTPEEVDQLLVPEP